jgi:hypothetical protein
MPWLETAPMEQRERFVRDHQLALYTMAELSTRYGISAKSRSRSFPSRLRLTQIASRDFNVGPRQLIGRTARPWAVGAG